MVLAIILITIAIVGLILFVEPLTSFFEFERLSSSELLLCMLISFVSVIWLEIVKWIKRTNGNV